MENLKILEKLLKGHFLEIKEIAEAKKIVKELKKEIGSREDSIFICWSCGKRFFNYECADELADSWEYFCKECWGDI